jgi:hypothetical protein
VCTINCKNAAPVVASDTNVRLKYGCKAGSLNSGAATEYVSTGILNAVAILLIGIVCELTISTKTTQRHIQLWANAVATAIMQ